MTNEERDLLRRELIDRLVAIYRKVRAEIDAETIGAALEADPVDTAEEGVDDELWSIAADLDGRECHLAHSIEDALRRMRRDDDYGICVDCGEEIPFERLRLVPWTDRCAADEARAEERNRHPTL